jgi:hypothetical protein
MTTAVEEARGPTDIESRASWNRTDAASPSTVVAYN